MATLKVLITQEQIQERVKQLAEQVANDYADRPLLLLCVLKGSVHFFSEFCLALGRDEDDIDFLQVSSYGSETQSSGVVKIKKDTDLSMEGRHVLIVEDIVDTGYTLCHLLELFATRRPASLQVLTLLNKAEARQVEVPIKYVGFDIPSEFVVGYGLDAAERYRNRADICVLGEN